jgi:hypothetical protein
VNEFNNACCGVNHDHSAAHYDTNQQVCCNQDAGFPSTRDYEAAYANGLMVGQVIVAGELV